MWQIFYLIHDGIRQSHNNRQENPWSNWSSPQKFLDKNFASLFVLVPYCPVAFLRWKASLCNPQEGSKTPAITKMLVRCWEDHWCLEWGSIQKSDWSKDFDWRYSLLFKSLGGCSFHFKNFTCFKMSFLTRRFLVWSRKHDRLRTSFYLQCDGDSICRDFRKLRNRYVPKFFFVKV